MPLCCVLTPTGSIRPGVIGGSKPRNVSSNGSVNSSMNAKMESGEHGDAYRTDNSIFNWELKEKLIKQDNRWVAFKTNQNNMSEQPESR